MTPVPEENRQTLFVILMLDITGLRQAEAEAADVRTRLTESLQTISEGIALWNSEDRLVICNARFIEFHAAVAHMLVPGCQFADFVRQSVMLGAPQEALGREGEWIAERIRRHGRPGTRFIQQTSEGRWLRTLERRTANREIICVETDVTEDQVRMREIAAARDAAEAASNAKSRFLAHMSHELRTPLNAIIGFSELIRDGLLGPDVEQRRQEYAEDIHQSGVSLLNMIDDILELTRLDSGTVPLKEEDIDPWTLVQECRQSLDSSEQERVKADLAPEQNDLEIRADRLLLSRCLRRLVDNALAFSNARNEVRIGADIDDRGSLRLYVIDKGPGISPSDTARCTEPFGRAGDVRTGQKPGLGLGLTLASMEIGLHGGRLEIDSGDGTGTTVSLVLPPYRTRPIPSGAGTSISLA